MSIHKSKDFAEQVARNLRCSGVQSAHVKEIIMYEVITVKKVSQVPEFIYPAWMCSDSKGCTSDIADCQDHNTEYYWSCDFKRKHNKCPRGYHGS